MNDRHPSQQILSSIGDQSRFRVVLELLKGEGCVSELAARVGLSQSCTTRHLQALERVGIVRSERAGKRVITRISTEPRVAALLAWALPGEAVPGEGVPGEVVMGGAVAGEEGSSEVVSAEVDPSEKPENPEVSASELDDTPAASGTQARQELEDFLL